MKTSGHGFGWAARQLLAGRRVRREEWGPDACISLGTSLDRPAIFHSGSNGPWIVPHDALLARDWVLFRPEPTYREYELVRPNGIVLLRQLQSLREMFYFDASFEPVRGAVVLRYRTPPNGAWGYSMYFPDGIPGDRRPVPFSIIRRLDA